MRVSIVMEMPPPSAKPPKHAYVPSLRDKVEHAIDCFHSNMEPEKAFKFLRRVHKVIVESGIKSKKAVELLKLISPIMEMHAKHELDGLSYIKTLNRE